MLPISLSPSSFPTDHCQRLFIALPLILSISVPSWPRPPPSVPLPPSVTSGHRIITQSLHVLPEVVRGRVAAGDSGGGVRRGMVMGGQGGAMVIEGEGRGIGEWHRRAGATVESTRCQRRGQLTLFEYWWFAHAAAILATPMDYDAWDTWWVWR